MNNNIIEKKVADAILEKAVASIDIEGKTYEIAPPTIATLILVSEVVATLPIVEKVSKEQIIYSSLHYAKDFRPLADMAAILILGAKNLIQEREVTRKLLGFIPFGKKKVRVDVKKELARVILDNMSPKILFDVIIQRLKDMEIASFFAITTSLSEANILKPTKEVEEP